MSKIPRNSSPRRSAARPSLFAYIDRISVVLVEEYGTERERMVRGAAHLRAETARAILAGEVIDEELAVRRLGYGCRAAPGS